MEKRKHTRVLFRAEATVKSGSSTISGTIDNLSMKGMFLNTRQSVAGDDLVDITIRLSGTDLSIDLKGKAVRKTDAGVAFEFREMDLDSFTHLKRIVTYNSDNADNVEDQFYKSVRPE